MKHTRRPAALVIHPRDNVGVALEDLPPGTEVELATRRFRGRIVVREPIPAYHKFALVRIRQGAPVVKYGEPIGEATTSIRPGAHVHVHNLQSRRIRPRNDRGHRLDAQS